MFYAEPMAIPQLKNETVLFLSIIVTFFLFIAKMEAAAVPA